MEFRNWFCLNDRESFTIDPKITPSDARFYFGRAEKERQLKTQLRKSFIAPGTPKMMIWGPYGSGKTQTLYYIDHYLKTDKPQSCRLAPRVLHLDIEVQSKSDASWIHIQMLETLGKEPVTQWVASLFDEVEDLRKELLHLVGDPNAVLCLQELRSGGVSSLTAWRWLTGQSLTTSELQSLKVTRNLGQVGAGDMVNVLVGIGKLAEKRGEELIYLIDEMEQLANVRTGDSTESIHQYFRKLADPANSSVGFIIGCTADTRDDMPRILNRADISTRIGEINYIEIPHLPAVQDVKTFVRELLQHLVKQDTAEGKIQQEGLGIPLETYPFSDGAFELLCDYASQDPVKALPRNLINSINECAIQAWDEQKQFVDEDIVNDVAPLVFG